MMVRGRATLSAHWVPGRGRAGRGGHGSRLEAAILSRGKGFWSCCREGLDGCPLVPRSRLGIGGARSTVALNLGVVGRLAVEPGPEHLGRLREPGEGYGRFGGNDG